MLSGILENRINRRDKAESAENKKRLILFSSSSLLFSLRLILLLASKMRHCIRVNDHLGQCTIKRMT